VSAWRSLGGAARFDPWVRMLRGKSGVYLIRRILTDEILYVGESHTGRLYETLTRHFQNWSGPTSGPTFMRWTVEVRTIVTTPARAVKLQEDLICKHSPEFNRSNPCAKVPF
jgi:excinuclease UvrABC nuclease subunit